MNYLNIPGLNNSGPGHWQTLWENSYPQQFRRVQQKSWSSPTKNEWVESLHTAIENYNSPVVLVAHSLGCITLAYWAAESNLPVVTGALLVAPADVENSVRECFKTFRPVPKSRLPFPSIVVASTNDPYASIENAARLAAYWGSKFVCAGDKGHINDQSDLGQWKEGLSVLSALTNSTSSTVPSVSSY